MVELIVAASVEIDDDAFGRGVRVRRGRLVVVLMPFGSFSSSFTSFDGLRVRLVLLVLLVDGVDAIVVVVVVVETVVLLTIGSFKSFSISSSLIASSSWFISDTGITTVDCVGRVRVGRVRRVVVLFSFDPLAAISSSVSGAPGNDGVVRVRRVRRGRSVVVVLVDKFIISTVIFARIFSCISIDGLLDGAGRVRLVLRGRIVVELGKSSAFHISYASVCVSISL